MVSALSQDSGSLSPFLPRTGVRALVMYNVHDNLGYLMGMELAKGGWLAQALGILFPQHWVFKHTPHVLCSYCCF